MLEIQGDLRLGRFAEVQKVVDGMKDKKGGEYWALRLSMADAYYARSEMKECRKIYEEFFKTVPQPGADLLDFYVESGFKWAQICVNEKNFGEAVKMYAGLLAKIPETGATEERWCAVAMEDVSLLIRLAEEMKDPKKAKVRADYLAQATKIVNKLLWKNELIIVFGKAIAMKAHIEVLNGDMEKAQGLVNEYMPQLSQIHASLLEQDPDGRRGYVRMSPMPECRYLLAQMLWEGAQAEAKEKKPDEEKIKSMLLGARGKNGKRNGLGAFNHAVNVYVKYPESSCAGAAGRLYEDIAAFVLARYKADLKKAVKISPDQMKKVRRMQFENAFAVYRTGDCAAAIKAYAPLIEQFPDAEEVPGAVAVLADCNLSLWHDAKDAQKKQAYRAAADAAEQDLVKRFAGVNDARARAAGDELQRLGGGERGEALLLLHLRELQERGRAVQRLLRRAGEPAQPGLLRLRVARFRGADGEELEGAREMRRIRVDRRDKFVVVRGLLPVLGLVGKPREGERALRGVVVVREVRGDAQGRLP